MTIYTHLEFFSFSKNHQDRMIDSNLRIPHSTEVESDEEVGLQRLPSSDVDEATIRCRVQYSDRTRPGRTPPGERQEDRSTTMHNHPVGCHRQHRTFSSLTSRLLPSSVLSILTIVILIISVFISIAPQPVTSSRGKSSRSSIWPFLTISDHF